MYLNRQAIHSCRGDWRSVILCWIHGFLLASYFYKPQISWNTGWLLTQVLFTLSHDLKNGVGNVPLIILKLTRENCLYRTMFLYEEPADLNQSGEANATISS